MSPHIAPINPAAGAAGYSQPSPGTPQMNIPDQTWNNGEAFRPGALADADYGGHLGYVDPVTGTYEYTPGVELGDIFHVNETLQIDQPRWEELSYTDPRTATTVYLWHFKGYIRPGQLGPYPAPTPPYTPTIEDAAFELFLPRPIPPADQIPTLLVHVWSTRGKPGPADGGRFAYPGSNRLDGLAGTPTALIRGADPAIPGLAAATGQTVMSGYIVTRIFGRPEVFAVQRARELRQVMRLMLAAPLNDYRHPPGLPVIPMSQSDVPCMVAGGSFGGLTTQALCVRYPAEFQGGSISVFGYTPRRVIADQFNFEYLATRGGFSPAGGAYNAEDSLEWGTAFRWMDQSPGSPGWDYFNLSCLLRRKRGELHHPLIWHAPDEDTIGHGTDSLSLITGTRNYPPRFATSSSPVLAFSAVDRRCHDVGWYTTALGNVPGVWHIREHTLELLPQAAISHAGNPNPPVPPLIADDLSEDSYSWVHDRALPPDAVAGPNPPLALDSTFGVTAGPPVLTPGRTAGAGLTLGADESLRFAVVGPDPSVFCGSADGVVTRFVLNPSTFTLDVAAQSVPLGFGAFALAVGSLDDGHAGMEVVVGTKNDLFILDAATLTVLNARQVPRPLEHSRPRRIQIADVFGGADFPGDEIVLTTLLGHVLVFAGDDGFTSLVDLGEPGVQDLAVLPGLVSAAATTASRVPLLLLSHRGHLAHVTLNKVTDPLSRNPHPAELQAWTAGEEGIPADLEIVSAPSGGGPVAACLYAHPGWTGSVSVPQILLFDALTLQPASPGTHGLPPGLGWRELGTAGSTRIIALDMAPVHASSGGALAGFVLLTGDRINWVPVSGAPYTGIPLDGFKLDGFPAASRAIAVTTGDLVTRAGSETYREEVILSTVGGHAVWFHLEDMLNNGANEFLNAVGPAPPTTTTTPYTNHTLAGQWGLLPHDVGAGTVLFGANQSGELFATDPVSGVGVFQDVIREPGVPAGAGQRQPAIVTAPIRDLALIGAGVTQSGSSSETQMFATSAPLSTLRWIASEPWENFTNDVLSPVWMKGMVVNPFNGQILNTPASLSVVAGLAAFVGGGDAIPAGSPVSGATHQAQWWGGDAETYTNLLQGVFADSVQVLENWYSSKDVPVAFPNLPPPVPQQSWRGRGSGDCKDLRNEVRAWAQINQMQSLRLGQDASGPVVVASTPGGSVVLIRAGRAAGQAGQDHGTILWDSADPTVPWDEGMNAMGLALQPVPGDPNQALDIFVGIGVTHLDPAPWLNGTGPGRLTGGIAWYRWVGTGPGTGTMSRIGMLHLDPNTGNPIGGRGGFGVCGLAIGDVIATQPGDELVATTLEGDLFVFRIPASGMLGPADVLFRTWARGALGVNNAIAVFDSDGDTRNELFIAGSLGIWKWKQP